MEDLFGINAHRQSVQENIEKAFDLGFDADNNIEGIEKAKHQVGDIHPNGRWVWTEYAPGKFDWKSLKGKHHKGSQQATSKISVDISKISDKEFNSITKILEKKNPDDSDAFRYLESEEMNDKELANFIACAKHFKNDTKNINETTRKWCAKWEKLGEEEIEKRKKDKQTTTKSTSSKGVDEYINKMADDSKWAALVEVMADIDLSDYETEEEAREAIRSKVSLKKLESAWKKFNKQ